MNMEKLNGIISTMENDDLATFVIANQTDTEAVLVLDPNTFSASNLYDGRVVLLKVFDSSSGLSIYSGTISYLKSNKLSIRDFVLERHIQRRMDVKVFIHFNIYIIHTFENSKNEKVREKLYLKLKDLSAGGICLATDLDLPEEDEYEFVFDRGRQPVVIKLKILRKTADPNDGFSYGCTFVDIDRAEEQIIREYVFKKQLH